MLRYSLFVLFGIILFIYNSNDGFSVGGKNVGETCDNDNDCNSDGGNCGGICLCDIHIDSPEELTTCFQDPVEFLKLRMHLQHSDACAVGTNKEKPTLLEISIDKVVLRVPQFWSDRGYLPGSNEPLLFILEKVYDNDIVSPTDKLQGTQKWLDFIRLRYQYADDTPVELLNTLAGDGIMPCGMCINSKTSDRIIYIAYIIQEYDYADFTLTNIRELNQLFFDYDKKILLCMSVSTNRYISGVAYFQYQMGIHRSIGYTLNKPEASSEYLHWQPIRDLYSYESVIDNGKGKGYGIISVKLHSFTSFALDLIDYINYGSHINRLLITHPAGDMTKHLINSGLQDDKDFYLEDRLVKPSGATIDDYFPENLSGLRDTILRTTGGYPRMRAGEPEDATLRVPPEVADFLQIDDLTDIDIGRVCINSSTAAFLSFNTVMSPLITK